MSAHAGGCDTDCLLLFLWLGGNEEVFCIVEVSITVVKRTKVSHDFKFIGMILGTNFINIFPYRQKDFSFSISFTFKISDYYFALRYAKY